MAGIVVGGVGALTLQRRGLRTPRDVSDLSSVAHPPSLWNSPAYSDGAVPHNGIRCIPSLVIHRSIVVVANSSDCIIPLPQAHRGVQLQPLGLAASGLWAASGVQLPAHSALP